jgi:putative ABC transport system permease protein
MIYHGVNPFAASITAMLGGMAAGLGTGLLPYKAEDTGSSVGNSDYECVVFCQPSHHGQGQLSLLRWIRFIQNLKKWLEPYQCVILFGLICVASVVGLLYWFFGTEIGCAIRATGNNPQMARAQGINTNNMIILGLVISNGLVAFSGALIAQSQSFADVQMGIGSIVIGLASVIIGEVLFGKRNFFNRLLSLVMGAVTYRIIIALVLKMGMPANDLKLFTAITVAAALSLPIGKAYLRPIRKSMARETENHKNSIREEYTDAVS